MNEKIENDDFIDSIQSITNGINESSNESDRKPCHGKDNDQISYNEVRKVMKDMGLSYRKVVHIPLGANSERSMVLR